MEERRIQCGDGVFIFPHNQTLNNTPLLLDRLPLRNI